MNDNRPDLLLGANAIANYLGCTRRQAYKMLYHDGLPSFRIGGTVAASQSAIDGWLKDLQARAVA